MSHLVDLIEIGTGITTNEQYAEQIVDIADIIDVQRIDDLHAVYDHIIGIEFRLQSLRGETPHTLVVLHEIHNAWSIVFAITIDLDFLCWQEITCNLYLLSLGGDEVKGNGIVSMYIRRCHLRTLSPAQILLSLCY